MVEVKIVKKPGFRVSGKKVFITGQDNSQFEKFWSDCHGDGTVERLKKMSSDPSLNVTGSVIFGVSRVEKDPENRAFDFYIASENDGADGFHSFDIGEYTWAIFRGTGNGVLDALIESEMYAFTEWLPKSEYKHAYGPELEVYPDNAVEFWLPIEKK